MKKFKYNKTRNISMKKLNVTFLLLQECIQDTAGWHNIGKEDEKWLVDEVAKEGTILNFQPSVFTYSNEIEISEKPYLKKIKDKTYEGDNVYEISGKILGGLESGYFLIDTGIKMRLHIINRIGIDVDQLKIKEIIIGQCIKFKAHLVAHTTDLWQGGVICHTSALIKKRRKVSITSENNFDLLLNLTNIKTKKVEYHPDPNIKGMIIKDSYIIKDNLKPKVDETPKNILQFIKKRMTELGINYFDFFIIVVFLIIVLTLFIRSLLSLINTF